MPEINGRYYMNPAYGRARTAENNHLTDLGHGASQQQDDNGRWVTIGHRHVWIKDVHDHITRVRKHQGAVSHKKPGPAQETKKKAEAGYGETSGLVPEKSADAHKNASPYDRSTWDPASIQQLQDARQNIMDISDRNSTVKKGTPSDPNNPIQQKASNDNLAAAQNSNGSKPGNFFFIRQEGKSAQHPPQSARYGQGQPVLSYGPFRNVGGGDVPRGNKTYIDIYDK